MDWLVILQYGISVSSFIISSGRPNKNDLNRRNLSQTLPPHTNFYRSSFSKTFITDLKFYPLECIEYLSHLSIIYCENGAHHFFFLLCRPKWALQRLRLCMLQSNRMPPTWCRRSTWPQRLPHPLHHGLKSAHKWVLPAVFEGAIIYHPESVLVRSQPICITNVCCFWVQFHNISNFCSTCNSVCTA